MILAGSSPSFPMSVAKYDEQGSKAGIATEPGLAVTLLRAYMFSDLSLAEDQRPGRLFMPAAYYWDGRVVLAD